MSKESKKVSGRRKECEMILIFRRTGERRYGIEAIRDSFPDLQMNPAAGYHPLIPHDLMHLVVEAQLGLTGGVFGQLATGGDGGTFQPFFDRKLNKRAASRIRKRGRKLFNVSRDECAESEKAIWICWQEWLARSKAKNRQTTAESVAPQTKQVRKTSSATGLRVLNERKMDEICQHLDQLSSEWSKLEVGQSMAVRWPDLAVSSDAESLQRSNN